MLIVHWGQTGDEQKRQKATKSNIYDHLLFVQTNQLCIYSFGMQCSISINFILIFILCALFFIDFDTCCQNARIPLLLQQIKWSSSLWNHLTGSFVATLNATYGLCRFHLIIRLFYSSFCLSLQIYTPKNVVISRWHSFFIEAFDCVMRMNFWY